jgi:4a-hydroxytetrahydrobiopterin dehydratase
MAGLLSQEEIDRALSGELSAWTQDGNAITRQVKAPTFLEGIALIVAVARVAEDADHHPDIDVRYRTLTFTLSTHAAGGLTAADLKLAREIDNLAG